MSDLKVNVRELDSLRRLIIHKYRMRRNQDLEIKSSLNTYEDLEFDISSFVENDPHVSKGLLRKLFYETKEESHTIFRSSFIDTCYRYISDNRHDRKNFLLNNKKTNWNIIAKATVPILLLFLMTFLLFPDFFKSDEELHTKKGGTNNDKAYETLMKAEYLHFTKFGASMASAYYQEAKKMYNEAIALDPTYSDAYAGLADLYHSYVTFYGDDSFHLVLFKEAIEKAHDLDSNSSYMHEVKAFYHHHYDEFEKGRHSQIRAIELSPAQATYAYVNLAGDQFKLGLADEAIKPLDLALSMDPANDYFLRSKARLLFHMGHLEQAKKIFDEARLMNENNLGVLNGLVHIYYFENQPEKIKEIIDWLTEINPEREYHTEKAVYYATLKDTARSLQYRKNHPLILAYVGDWDGYLKWYEEYYAGNHFCHYLKWKAIQDQSVDKADEIWLRRFKPLKDHPRFKALLDDQKNRYEYNVRKYSLKGVLIN